MDKKLMLSDQEIIIRFLLGNSQEKIGLSAGVTRQRIQQILKKSNVGKETRESFLKDLLNYVSIKDLAIKLGVSVGIIRYYIGIPLFGRNKFISPENALLIEKSITVLKCKICNNIILPPRRSYCNSECHQEALKFTNWTDTRKKRHRSCVESWQRKHPERYKEISRKANKRYREKKRNGI